MESDGSRERRRDYRVAVKKGRAYCSEHGRGRWFNLKNVSKGGACLVGKSKIALGTHVNLEMTIEGLGKECVQGTVVRNAPSLGIRFKDVGFTAGMMLDELEWDDVIKRERSMTLVLTSKDMDCAPLSAALQNDDISTLNSDSFRDACAQLADPWMPISSVIVTGEHAQSPILHEVSNEFSEVAWLLACRQNEWPDFLKMDCALNLDAVILVPWEYSQAASIVRSAESIVDTKAHRIQSLHAYRQGQQPDASIQSEKRTIARKETGRSARRVSSRGGI